MPDPRAAIGRLDRLIGLWKTTGQTRDDPPVKIDFIDTYALVADGCFIEHRVDGQFGDQHSEAIEIIGADGEGYFARSFDSAGEAMLFSASLDGDVWRLDSESMRFEGRFVDGGGRIEGRWERRQDGAWSPWMDIVLEKER